jgi:SAM-dependent methyltransferase
VRSRQVRSASRATSDSGRTRLRQALWLAVAGAGLLATYGALRVTNTPAPSRKVAVTFAEAQPIVHALGAQLPPPLAGLSDEQLRTAWPAWTSSRDAEIRARLQRGDEDSVVHFWLFGTSFTSKPRATSPRLASLDSGGTAALLEGRLDDLIEGMRAPGDNDRLVVARRVLERSGIDVTTPAGRLEARRHLDGLRERMASEFMRFQQATLAARQADDADASFDAYLEYYRGRGLSSDTSLLAAYSVERALHALLPRGLLAPGGVRRVAVVGPGLDFVDKAEGHDFYPQQTLQPFALVDSLARTGLAHPDGVDLTTFDISPRVADHLAEARARAERGEPYAAHLPLAPDDANRTWHPDLVAYWQRFGDRIGVEVAPAPLPPGIEDVRVRAVHVRPDLVRSIETFDLDVIVERLRRPETDPGFDLIVATNILVYYEPFEQALALSNLAAMLRPDGLLLVNTLKLPLPLNGLSSPFPVDVVFDMQGGGDMMQWFRRVASQGP